MKISRDGKRLIATKLSSTDEPLIKELGFRYDERFHVWARSYNEDVVLNLIRAEADVHPELLIAVTPSTVWDSTDGWTLPSKRSPYEWQAKANHLLLEQKRFMLAAQVGTGKTKPVVDCTSYLLAQNKADFAVVITSNNSLYEWARIYIGKDSEETGIAIDGSETERVIALQWAIKNGRKWLVLSYTAMRMPKVVAALKMYCTSKTVFVMDETHNVKSVATSQFKGIYGIICAARPRHIWALTGTPMSQSPEDIFGQAACIDTNHFGVPSKWFAFLSKYVIKNPNNKHHTVGYRNMDDLMRKFNSMALRVRKDEVFELPPLIEEEVLLQIPAQLRKYYEKFCKDAVAAIQTLDSNGKPVGNPLDLYMKSSQIVNNWVYETKDVVTDDGVESQRTAKQLFATMPNPKLDWIIDFLQNGEQTIIWTRFKQNRALLIEALAKAKISFVSFGAGMNNIQRFNAVREFEQRNAQVFESNPKSGGESLNLQFAKYQIYFDIPISVKDYEQSLGRIHRAGLQHSTTAYHLLYDQTSEVTQFKQLQNKLEVSRIVTDGDSEDFIKALTGELWV